MSQQSNQRLNAANRDMFIWFTCVPDVLDRLLKVDESKRPALAAELFNRSHPNNIITVEQAHYIGEHYYIENNKICELTPEIKNRL